MTSIRTTSSGTLEYAICPGSGSDPDPHPARSTTHSTNGAAILDIGVNDDSQVDRVSAGPRKAKRPRPAAPSARDSRCPADFVDQELRARRELPEARSIDVHDPEGSAGVVVVRV